MRSNTKYLFVIALLTGIIIGNYLPKSSADTTSQGMDRQTFLEGMALCGILANERHDPFGDWGLFAKYRGKDSFREAAKGYASLMNQ